MPRATRGPKKSFLCRECDKRVRIPNGWSLGPSVRRHYWRRHPEVMRARGKGSA